MKQLFGTIAVVALLASFSTTVRADDEKTLKGEAMCAKCELKEAKACQAAIRVKENGKTVTYLADNNKVSKDFHKNICSATEKVTATGTVKEVDGKKQITLSKIELDKK